MVNTWSVEPKYSWAGLCADELCLLLSGDWSRDSQQQNHPQHSQNLSRISIHHNSPPASRKTFQHSYFKYLPNTRMVFRTGCQSQPPHTDAGNATFSHLAWRRAAPDKTPRDPPSRPSHRRPGPPGQKPVRLAALGRRFSPRRPPARGPRRVALRLPPARPQHPTVTVTSTGNSRVVGVYPRRPVRGGPCRGVTVEAPARVRPAQADAAGRPPGGRRGGAGAQGGEGAAARRGGAGPGGWRPEQEPAHEEEEEARGPRGSGVVVVAGSPGAGVVREAREEAEAPAA